MARKKLLSTPSSTSSGFARSGIRRSVDGSHQTQIARAAQRWLRRGQRFSPVSGGEACGISRDPNCIQNKELYDDANSFLCDLILLFRHQLMDKIRCERKYLDRITFDRRWVNAASLFVLKGVMLESSFPPLPAHGVYGPGPSGPHPG